MTITKESKKRGERQQDSNVELHCQKKVTLHVSCHAFKNFSLVLFAY